MDHRQDPAREVQLPRRGRAPLPSGIVTPSACPNICLQHPESNPQQTCFAGLTAISSARLAVGVNRGCGWPSQIIKQQMADGVKMRRVGFVSKGAPARAHSEVQTPDGETVRRCSN